jgi:carbon-monoxide dehydrogenase medium subunit
MTRHCEVAGSPDVVRTIPALAHLAGQIGDRQVRNVGTLGGSLANNDPAACYPAAALGLGATIHTSRRSIPADEFLSGMYETCLAADELIASVSLPIPRGAAYEKFRQPASRFALVGVFIARRQSEVRVAVTGAGLGGVFRVKSMELALTREFDVQSLDGITVDVDGLSGDIHASAEYRAHLITVLARRAVAQIAGAGTL